MKRLLLATAAVGALAFPALAQQQGQQSMPSQSGQQSSQHSGQQSSQMRISPENLSQDQVEQLQQALNDKGFDAGDVDGIWGPETRAALRNFQEEHGMKGASGQLDPETLQALGLDASKFASGPSSTTTGSGGQDTGSSGSQGMGSSQGSSSQGMGSQGDMNKQPQNQSGSPKNQ